MESKKAYKLSEDVVYRVIEDRLVLIEAASSTFYNFSKESEGFFNMFKEPRLVSENNFAPESQSQALWDMLVEKKILVPAEGADVVASEAETEMPMFLGIGKERLERVHFLY